jgi:hypothetical protein
MALAISFSQGISCKKFQKHTAYNDSMALHRNVAAKSKLSKVNIFFSESFGEDERKLIK